MLKVLGWSSIVFLVCTAICALWMQFAPGEKDVHFHAMLSMIAIVISFVTIICYMIKYR